MFHTKGWLAGRPRNLLSVPNLLVIVRRSLFFGYRLPCSLCPDLLQYACIAARMKDAMPGFMFS